MLLSSTTTRPPTPSWMGAGFHPVPDRVMELKNADDILLVDVGGSVGNDLSEFHRKWPSMSARLVLQDLPDVAITASGHFPPSRP